MKVPWQALTNKAYAKSIANQIDINKAKPSSEIRPGNLRLMRVIKLPITQWWIKTVTRWR
ncbi:hypothetical protein ACVXG9_12230 [Escherichia coli]